MSQQQPKPSAANCFGGQLQLIAACPDQNIDFGTLKHRNLRIHRVTQSCTNRPILESFANAFFLEMNATEYGLASPPVVADTVIAETIPFILLDDNIAIGGGSFQPQTFEGINKELTRVSCFMWFWIHCDRRGDKICSSFHSRIEENFGMFFPQSPLSSIMLDFYKRKYPDLLTLESRLLGLEPQT